MKNVAGIGDIRNAYTFLVGKIDGKGQPERYKCSWEITMKCILQKIDVRL